MQRYNKIKKLEAGEFGRLTGVKHETFIEMVEILKAAEKTKMSKVASRAERSSRRKKEKAKPYLEKRKKKIKS